jgi:hypothetical protein
MVDRITTTAAVVLGALSVVLFVGAMASSMGAIGTATAANGFQDAWRMFWGAGGCVVGAVAISVWKNA